MLTKKSYCIFIEREFDCMVRIKKWLNDNKTSIKKRLIIAIFLVASLYFIVGLIQNNRGVDENNTWLSSIYFVICFYLLPKPLESKNELMKNISYLLIFLVVIFFIFILWGKRINENLLWYDVIISIALILSLIFVMHFMYKVMHEIHQWIGDFYDSLELINRKSKFIKIFEYVTKICTILVTFGSILYTIYTFIEKMM